MSTKRVVEKSPSPFFIFLSLSLSLGMTDAPGQGAERAAAADVACDDSPPQASDRGGQEEVRGSEAKHQEESSYRG